MKRYIRGVATVAASVCLLAAAADPAGYGPVGHDTLWTVAKKINEQQHLGTRALVAWALYKMNPQAFDGAPGKIRYNSTFMVPDKAMITSVSGTEAYANLTGAPAPVVAPALAAAKPAPVKPAPTPAPAPVTRVFTDPHAAPVIQGVELKPAVAGRQLLGVIGANFRPGAKLDLHDMINGTSFKGLAPSHISGDRIDYVAKVGAAQSHWLVTVRNADGTVSEAFGFAAGPGAGSAGMDEIAAKQAQAAAAERAAAEAAAAAAQQAAAQRAAEEAAAEAATVRAAAEKAAAEKTAAARQAAEKPAPEPAPAEAVADRAEVEAVAREWAAQDKAAAAAAAARDVADQSARAEAALAKAIADKAALDREFEAKMAADRAAYEKSQAGAKPKK